MKFDVDGGGGGIGNGGEGGGGEDDGGAGVGGAGDGGEGVVEDPDEDGLAGDACPRLGRAYAPHQVPPPARRSVVPHPFPRRPEHVARREHRRVPPVTLRRCPRHHASSCI